MEMIMKLEWEELFKYVNSYSNNTPSWQSDKKSLLAIIKWADDHGVNLPMKGDWQTTKLRAIIKPAKEAIRKRDIERLDQLLFWVKSQTLIELRHNLGISPVEEIYFEDEFDGVDHNYVIRLRPDQLERIQALTKSRYQFTSIGEK